MSFRNIHRKFEPGHEGLATSHWTAVFEEKKYTLHWAGVVPIAASIIIARHYRHFYQSKCLLLAAIYRRQTKNDHK